jgi:hypothetical protein
MPKPPKIRLQTIKVSVEGLRLLRLIAADSDEFMHQALDRLLQKEFARIRREQRL